MESGEDEAAANANITIKFYDLYESTERASCMAGEMLALLMILWCIHDDE